MMMTMVKMMAMAMMTASRSYDDCRHTKVPTGDRALKHRPIAADQLPPQLPMPLPPLSMVLVSGRTLVGPASREVALGVRVEVQADCGHRQLRCVTAVEARVPDQSRVGGLTEGWCMQIDPAIAGAVPTTTTRCTPLRGEVRSRVVWPVGSQVGGSRVGGHRSLLHHHRRHRPHHHHYDISITAPLHHQITGTVPTTTATTPTTSTTIPPPPPPPPL